MFSRISGTIAGRDDQSVLVDVNGLGYDVLLPPCVGEKLSRTIGDPVQLEIYPSFSLDGNAGRFTFFGFSNAIEREFFEALLSVASIGPKTAARAFSLPMARIAKAIDTGDHAFLVKLPGIGQQKARDIVAKLQGKVAKFLLIQDAAPRERVAQTQLPAFAEEALAVLLQLEYRRTEAEAMIEETLREVPDVRDPERLLAEVYRLKNRRGDAAAGAA